MSTAVILGVLGAGSALAGGYSAMQAGEAQKDAYYQQAALLERNAKAKRMETSLNEDTLRAQKRREMSTLRASMSENNVLNATSSLGVLGDSAAGAEQDVLNMRYKGENEAINYLNNAIYSRYQGDVAEDAGKQAFQMSFLEAGISGLGGYALGGGKFGFGEGIKDMSAAAKADWWAKVPKR